MAKVNKLERLASCDCGKVQIALTGPHILCCVCYCDDCQAGGRQLEQLGAYDFRDEWGGTPLLVYRDDRFVCVKGSDLLQGIKIRPSSPTTRFIATCCKSAMFLKYSRGWWTSLYRARFQGDVPLPEMRSQTRHVPDARLPGDVAIYGGFPASLFLRLLTARLAMALGS